MINLCEMDRGMGCYLCVYVLLAIGIETQTHTHTQCLGSVSSASLCVPFHMGGAQVLSRVCVWKSVCVFVCLFLQLKLLLRCYKGVINIC